MQTGFNLEKASKTMREEGLDCIIATSHDNVFYSSGADIMTITMLKRLAAIFLPLDSEPVFGVHRNEEVTAQESTWIKDIRVYSGGEWEPLKPIEFVASILKEKDLGDARIGIEMLDMPGLCLDHLRKLLPSARFADCQPVFDKLRAVKSPDELKLLSEANMLTAKAITLAFEMARPGDSERQLARNMIGLTHQYGADSVAFLALGAGKNIFEFHHMPTDYSIKKGDLVHVDFGCYFNGYLSDISRTAVVGQPDETQLRAHDIAIRAEQAVAAALKAEAKVVDVHNAARQLYESEGLTYDKAFIGHGLGIGCHEYPFLGPSHADWVLEPGMFFQVEPSVVLGQVRIHTEDSFTVTEKGGENVSEYRDISAMQVIS
jgi:Xaa-Pro aminopeptidase